jgi:adenosylhomocysteine nucleosidase
VGGFRTNAAWRMMRAMSGRMVLVLALTACASRSVSPPAPPAAPPIVVVVSANAEWKALRLPGSRVADTPYGEWFVHRFGTRDVIFFHGGYAKVASAGSTQYAITRWHPALLVNLGTCGGFGPDRKVGDIVLANQTIIYDIIEQMGDPDEAIRDYSSTIDTKRWPARLASRVTVGPLISADRDLIAKELPALAAKYHASAGDWESGAIAWIAGKNKTPVLILRAVTDLVDATGDATYGNVAAWQQQSITAMASLVDLFSAALPDL